MKTLASFVFVILAILMVTYAHQWRRGLLADAEKESGELRLRLAEMDVRFDGYWPRYEQMEDALEASSNLCLRLTSELEAERTANAPLREQVGALSAARIAQGAREADLQKAHDAAVSAGEQLQALLQKTLTAQADAENREKALQNQAKALEGRAVELEETLRTRDSESTGLRQELEREKAESNRLRDANAVIPGLQAEMTSARAALDAASTERDQARKERDTASGERDRLKAALDAMAAERDQARRERDVATAERSRLEEQLKAVQPAQTGGT